MTNENASVLSQKTCDYLRTEPFTTRPFTEDEFTEKDVYLYFSPRHKRLTCVDGIPRLAQSLLFEFDPKIVHCVERPRTLTFDPERSVELDFWTRNDKDEESFWVMLSNHETRADLTGRVPKDLAQWEHAASSAGLRLQFVIEDDLLKQSVAIANAFRMLGHVQANRRVPNTKQIQRRIRELFLAHEQLAFRQIDGSLKDFPAQEVRAATCHLIHQGTLFLDPNVIVCENAVVYRRPFA